MSKIEWTGKTWNPTLGCKEVSPGCTHCYAARMAFRLSHMPAMKEDYAGLTKKLPNGKIVWTGLVKEMPGRLFEPINIKKPTLWFVDSMSDLFHKDVSFDFIDNVFAVMDCCPQHTFQILTKRTDRAVEYFKEKRAWRVGQLKYAYDSWDIDLSGWPLKNVWIGTSVENQKEADVRIPLLLQIPAAVRFLSCEPLLGPVDFSKIIQTVSPGYFGDCLLPYHIPECDKVVNKYPVIGWVICGGESGPGARPMHPDWARSLRDQCAAAGVSFFFKQWGEYMPYEETAQAPYHRSSATLEEFDGHGMNFFDENSNPGSWNGGKWMDVLEASMLCDETLSDQCMFHKVGKKAAGNMLDGVQHLQYPEIINS